MRLCALLSLMEPSFKCIIVGQFGFPRFDLPIHRLECLILALYKLIHFLQSTNVS